MADYTVGEDEVAVHNKTLVASAVDTVTFFDALEAIEVISDGAAKIYVTTDGSAPTVAGANTRVIPATICARVIRMSSGKSVKLISSGSPTYSIERA